MSFADLEARLNTATLAFLANATAVVGAASFGVIFDKNYGEYELMSGSKPGIQALAADVSGLADGDALTVNAVAYTVSGQPRPDGTGITLIMLDAA